MLNIRAISEELQQSVALTADIFRECGLFVTRNTRTTHSSLSEEEGGGYSAGGYFSQSSNRLQQEYVNIIVLTYTLANMHTMVQIYKILRVCV